MRMINLWRVAFAILAAFSLASCSSDEPQWADPESHEKTEQLRKQYTPIIHGNAQMADPQTRHHRRQGAIYGLAGKRGL